MRGISRSFSSGVLALVLSVSCFLVSVKPVHAGSLGEPDVPNYYTFAYYVSGPGRSPVDGAESDEVPSGNEASEYWRNNPAAQVYVTCPINEDDGLDPPVSMGILYDEHGDPK